MWWPNQNAVKTHCQYGHEFTRENTYYDRGTKHRHCRECNRLRSKQRRDAAKRSVGGTTAEHLKLYTLMGGKGHERRTHQSGRRERVARHH